LCQGCGGEIKAARGPGAAGRRSASLGGLLARATEAERHFLVRLVMGELRQGAQEGVVVDAVARAFQVPAADVRRATMLAGSLPAVAAALASEGHAALARFDLQLFQPVQPMLADTADDVNAAWERLGAGVMALDFKLDGARVQVHKDGPRVEVYEESDEQARGAVRLAPDRAVAEARGLGLPPDAPLVLYCTCPNDATSARVARDLMRNGWPRARALIGGFDAWKAAGLGVEAKRAA